MKLSAKQRENLDCERPVKIDLHEQSCVETLVVTAMLHGIPSHSPMSTHFLRVARRVRDGQNPSTGARTAVFSFSVLFC